MDQWLRCKVCSTPKTDDRQGCVAASYFILSFSMTIQLSSRRTVQAAWTWPGHGFTTKFRTISPSLTVTLSCAWIMSFLSNFLSVYFYLYVYFLAKHCHWTPLDVDLFKPFLRLFASFALENGPWRGLSCCWKLIRFCYYTLSPYFERTLSRLRDLG